MLKRIVLLLLLVSATSQNGINDTYLNSLLTTDESKFTANQGFCDLCPSALGSTTADLDFNTKSTAMITN